MAGLTVLVVLVWAVICTNLEEVLSAPACGKAVSIDITSEAGVRTGKGHGSGVRFDRLDRPVKSGDHVTIDFRADREGGLLLYLATQDHTNYIQVFLENGKPRLRMRCGEFQSDVHSHLPSMKDGEFHVLTLARSSRKEKLIIDSRNAFRTYYSTCPDLDLVYIGGVPSQRYRDTTFKDIRRFQGCLKNFKLNGEPFDETPTYTSVSTC